MLELTDGTELPTYQSPHLPFGRGAEWSDPVCNLYSMLKSQEAMRGLFDELVRPRPKHAAGERGAGRTAPRTASVA